MSRLDGATVRHDSVGSISDIHVLWLKCVVLPMLEGEVQLLLAIYDRW